MKAVMKSLAKALICFSLSLSISPTYAGTSDHNGAQLGMIMIEDVTIRATTKQAGATAAYAMFHNHGTQDDRLIAASVSFAKKTEIHEMTMVGEVMKMRALSGGLALPAGAMTALKSGAEHIMIMGLSQQIMADMRYDITLTFEKAGSITVPAQAISLSGKSHKTSHDDHGHNDHGHKH